MAWFDGILEAGGEALKGAGANLLESGLGCWKACSDMVIGYCTQDPTSLGPWRTISVLYGSFLGVGASLMTLYFVMGWLRESVDIRTTFTAENLFKMFIRLIITAALLDGALTLIVQLLRLGGLLAAQVGAQIQTDYNVSEIFDAITEGMEGGDMLGAGFVCLLGGLLGFVAIIVSGVSILLTVLTRFFKIFMTIPFAPPALASFAGGHGLSQSGISWLKTFFSYCLEVVAIGLALLISFLFFRGNNSYFNADAQSWAGVFLGILNVCLPMLTAVACVKGAEMTVRRALGL